MTTVVNVASWTYLKVYNVMVDRTLNIPQFPGKRKQLALREVTEAQKIAELCIHEERAIGRI